MSAPTIIPGNESGDDPTLRPYGLGQLDKKIQKNRHTGKIKCVVKGCQRWLRPPTRKPKFSGDVCPEHGIRVHSSGTFTYADYHRNLIVDADYFHDCIYRNPDKFESHRFGQERSEDAVTWNVFRSLQRAGCLHEVVRLCTGIERAEPKLFLWGLELKDAGIEPWNLLAVARKRFESDLPSDRPRTEPDIGLFLPGHYLILIEAKFTSPNGTYLRDRVKRPLDFTIDRFIDIYHDDTLKILDPQQARRQESIFYQLWRNLLFSEYISRLDSPETRAYHVNLVRQGQEEDACAEFLAVVRHEYHDRFEQVTWEQLFRIADKRQLQGLCRYMETKTEGLRPAFRI